MNYPRLNINYPRNWIAKSCQKQLTKRLDGPFWYQVGGVVQPRSAMTSNWLSWHHLSSNWMNLKKRGYIFVLLAHAKQVGNGQWKVAQHRNRNISSIPNETFGTAMRKHVTFCNTFAYTHVHALRACSVYLRTFVSQPCPLFVIRRSTNLSRCLRSSFTPTRAIPDHKRQLSGAWWFHCVSRIVSDDKVMRRQKEH